MPAIYLPGEGFEVIFFTNAQITCNAFLVGDKGGKTSWCRDWPWNGVYNGGDFCVIRTRLLLRQQVSNFQRQCHGHYPRYLSICCLCPSTGNAAAAIVHVTLCPKTMKCHHSWPVAKLVWI